MLSDKEKQELREMAGSQTLRDEFRLLRRLSLAHRPVDVDSFIQFLTTMARLHPNSSPLRAFVEYTSVRL